MKKVLILASGGLDSSVVVALYKNLGYDVHLLYLPYGNINAKAEVKKVRNLATKFNIPTVNTYVHPLNLDYTNSKCVGDSDGSYYVEMRNLIFLSYAVSIAEVKGINEIAVGFIKTVDEYIDTSEEFVTLMNNLSIYATGVEIKAPLKQLTKREVYELGSKLGVNLKDTFSCNFGEIKPCGECYDCVDLKQLIRECNVPDDDNPFI